MRVATGTVINGKVVLEGVTLPEGALVTVLSTDTEASIKLSPAEEADLLAALDEADGSRVSTSTAFDDARETLATAYGPEFDDDLADFFESESDEEDSDQDGIADADELADND